MVLQGRCCIPTVAPALSPVARVGRIPDAAHHRAAASPRAHPTPPRTRRGRMPCRSQMVNTRQATVRSVSAAVEAHAWASIQCPTADDVRSVRLTFQQHAPSQPPAGARESTSPRWPCRVRVINTGVLWSWAGGINDPELPAGIPTPTHNSGAVPQRILR